MAGTNQFPQQPSGMPPMGQPTMSTGRIPGGMPPTGRPGAPMSGQQPEKKKKSKKPLIIVIIILLVAILGLGIWWLLFANGGWLDSNAKSGQAPYKTNEEVQAELNRQVEEGMFNISIASVVEFPDGTSPGTAYIENIPGNRYDMMVEITLDDTGESVYQSGALAPDSYIDDITLTKDLDAGTYPSTATFTAYDHDSHEAVGKAAAKVSLVVRN